MPGFGARLQEDVKNISMRLFHLVKENDRKGAPPIEQAQAVSMLQGIWPHNKGMSWKKMRVTGFWNSLMKWSTWQQRYLCIAQSVNTQPTLDSHQSTG